MAKKDKDSQNNTQQEDLDTAAEQGATEEGKPSYEELAAALADAQQAAEEAREQLLRGKAEAENARKRAEREVANAHKYALEKFIGELLPIKDSLEMGFNAASVEGADLDKVREGVELTLKMFDDILKKSGVEEINPVGETFNPELHQAMSMQDVPDAAPNTVINVFQKGFSLNDRLVRPAMVVVAGPNSGGSSDSGDDASDSSKIDEMA